mmetsp:Transcript_21635/g.33039  ORF Transcript_21635/g.33039 Transcript_21635/m.33039 type:complete len:362 (+) Transcript_21635:192-1277(+)
METMYKMKASMRLVVTKHPNTSSWSRNNFSANPILIVSISFSLTLIDLVMTKLFKQLCCRFLELIGMSHANYLFLLRLVLHALDTCPDGIQVTQVSSLKRGYGTFLWDWFEIFIQLIHERSSGWNVEFCNGSFVDIVQVFHQCSQRVSMGSNNNCFSVFELWSNIVFVVRQDTIQGSCKRFCEFVFKVEISVTRIVAWVMIACSINCWRWDIVRTPPDENLILSITIDCLLLVQSLERTVVALVEFPSLVHRNPHKIRLFQHVPEGTNSSLQQRSVRDIQLDSFCCNKFSGFCYFLVTFWGKWHVNPTSEFVFQVPSRFSMPYQNKSVFISDLLLKKPICSKRPSMGSKGTSKASCGEHFG